MSEVRIGPLESDKVGLPADSNGQKRRERADYLWDAHRVDAAQRRMPLRILNEFAGLKGMCSAEFPSGLRNMDPKPEYDFSAPARYRQKHNEIQSFPIRMIAEAALGFAKGIPLAVRAAGYAKELVDVAPDAKELLNKGEALLGLGEGVCGLKIEAAEFSDYIDLAERAAGSYRGEISPMGVAQLAADLMILDRLQDCALRTRNVPLP